MNRKPLRRQVRLPYKIRGSVDLASFRLPQTYLGNIELEKEQAVIPGFGDGSLPSTEEDKVDTQRIRTKLEANDKSYCASQIKKERHG